MYDIDYIKYCDTVYVLVIPLSSVVHTVTDIPSAFHLGDISYVPHLRVVSINIYPVAVVRPSPLAIAN